MNSFRSGMNSFQIEIMENCGDKVRNEFIPDRNEFIPVNFFFMCYCELCMTETPVACVSALLGYLQPAAKLVTGHW